MEGYMRASKNYTKKPDITLFQKHTHSSYEIFCFVSGDARYFIEGNIYDLKPNDILLIKKSEIHTLLINKEIPYTRYVIHFKESSLLPEQAQKLISIVDEKPLGKFNRIPSTEVQKSRWLYYLENIVAAENFEDKQMYLTVLLTELCDNIGQAENDGFAVSENEKLIEYINRNLMTLLSIEEVCEHFHISKTHLNRRFKAMTGTTVWEYIVTKRLIVAQEMLADGYRPGIVSERCGWSEYSSFYRAYRQHFGTSPGQDCKR